MCFLRTFLYWKYIFCFFLNFVHHRISRWISTRPSNGERSGNRKQFHSMPIAMMGTKSHIIGQSCSASVPNKTSHTPTFPKFSAEWEGLRRLVSQVQVKLVVIPTSWAHFRDAFFGGPFCYFFFIFIPPGAGLLRLRHPVNFFNPSKLSWDQQHWYSQSNFVFRLLPQHLYRWTAVCPVPIGPLFCSDLVDLHWAFKQKYHLLTIIDQSCNNPPQR